MTQNPSRTHVADEVASLRQRVAELEVLGEQYRQRAEEERRLRLEQDTAFRRQHGLVRLLQSVATAANEAPSVAAALRIGLDRVCEHTGWPVGHAYVVEKSRLGRLVPSGSWHFDDVERFAAFRRESESVSFERGLGLPGQVLDRKEPVWVEDLSAQLHLPNATEAVKSGLRVGFAFPVFVRDEVVAVLEFFTPKAIPRDDEFLEVARHVGTQLGRVIERKHAEDALRLTRMQQQALSRRLLEIQELERSRIARELHDQIGQALTAVKLNFEATAQAHATHLRKEDVAESIALIDHAIEQVRTLSFELRPALLDDLGLAVAVGSYSKRVAAKAGLELRLAITRIDPIRKEVETACFRILQEALTNVVRHASASILEIELHEAEGVLELTVRDDGVGFRTESRRHTKPAQEQLGLLGMRERAQNVGGVFRAESRRGEGTVIRARLPLRASQRLERRVVAR